MRLSWMKKKIAVFGESLQKPKSKAGNGVVPVHMCPERNRALPTNGSGHDSPW